MGGVGGFGAGSGRNAEVSFSSASRFKNQIDHPPGVPSTSGVMPHGSEIGGRTMGMGSTETRSFGQSRRNDGGNITGGFPSTSWDDSALLSDSYLKDFAEDDKKTFTNLNSSQNQVGNCLYSLLYFHVYRMLQSCIVLLIRVGRVGPELPQRWLIT